MQGLSVGLGLDFEVGYLPHRVQARSVTEAGEGQLYVAPRFLASVSGFLPAEGAAQQVAAQESEGSVLPTIHKH